MRQSELSGITLQRIHLFLSHGIGYRFILIVRGCVMVGHAEYLLRTEALQSPRPQAVEGLRRSHLMAVQPVDIQLRRPVAHLLHHVPVPNLIK